MSHVFTDNAGRTWTVAVNVETIKRVRSLLKDDDGQPINLLAVVDKGGALMTRLAGDPILLADVLFVLVKDQADAQGVSDVQFGQALAGDAIEQASKAFLEDLADFFPRGQRVLIHAALAKAGTYQDLLEGRLLERIESADFETVIGKKLTADLAALNNSSTSSPASSE